MPLVSTPHALRLALLPLLAIVALASGTAACSPDNSRACEVDANCFVDERCIAGFCQFDPTPDAEDDAEENHTSADAEDDADTEAPDADANQPDTDANPCSPGLSTCNNTCVDLQQDPDYCGDCQTSCSDDESCIGGTCTTELNLIILDSEPDTGFFNDLALDNDGSPHIVYYADASRELRYATFNGTEWQHAVIERDLPLTTSTRIYIDAQNTPQIAYIRATGTPTPVHATRTREGWEVSDVYFAGDGPLDFSRGIGGRPTLAFYEIPFMAPALFALGDEGWTSLNSPASDDTIAARAIAGDASTPLAIAYKDADNTLMLATYDTADSDWQQTTLATSLATANTLALTLSPTSSPAIATLNSQRDELLIFRREGNAWSEERHPVGPADTEVATGAISLTATDNALAAGLHISTTDHARVLKFNALTSDWLPLLHESAHTDSNTSVAIDSQGRTHIIFVNPEGHLTYALLP